MANSKNTGKSKSKSTDYVTMEVIDGIFFLCYKPLHHLDITIAREVVRERVEFKQGTAYPSLFDVRKVRDISKEARDYMAEDGNDLVKASAIVLDSPMLRMMANFFIKVSKPKNPTRVFTDEASAIEWLQQFKTA